MKLRKFNQNMDRRSRFLCFFLFLVTLTIFTYAFFGTILAFTVATKPVIPEGAITPSIHSVDKITINGEKIYYNGTLQEGKVINLTVGHLTVHKPNPYSTFRSLIGIVLKTNETNGSLAVWDNANISFTSFGRTIKNADKKGNKTG